MAGEVAATEKPITVYGLIEVTEKFIRNCENSNDVDTRWLVEFIRGEPLTIMRQVRSGGLNPEYRARVTAFRAAELETEMTQKRRELEALERDLAKVRAA